MSPQERDYYRERAHAERLCAAEATSGVAAQIHQELACLYDKLVELDEQPPTLAVVTDERMTA